MEGGRHLIVTAGLGTSGIPLRIGVPPEFVLIEVTGRLTLRRAGHAFDIASKGGDRWRMKRAMLKS